MSIGDIIKVQCINNNIGSTTLQTRTNFSSISLIKNVGSLPETGVDTKYCNLISPSASLTTTDADVTWATQNVFDSDTFTHTPGTANITIPTNGTYIINANLSTGGVGNRTQTSFNLELDSVTITGTRGYMYNRNTTQDTTTACISHILNVTSAPVVLKMVARIDSGEAAATVISDGGALSIYKVSGLVGAVGPVGPAGDLNFISGGWLSSTTYLENDTVEYQGSTYRANATNLNDPPPSSNWDLVASKGDAGAAGDINFQGEWNSLTGYVINDTVQYLGSSYRANAASTNDPPPSANWDLVAAKGDPTAITVQELSLIHI